MHTVDQEIEAESTRRRDTGRTPPPVKAFAAANPWDEFPNKMRAKGGAVDGGIWRDETLSSS